MKLEKEPVFNQIRTRRVFEEICEQVRQQLASGLLKPGDKLPAERDLAATFKVSRSAVREAFRMLEISGIVELQKGVKGGAYIRDGNADTITQSLQDLMFLGRLSLKSLAEARMLISGIVVQLACERGTESDFIAIEKNIHQIEEFTKSGNLPGRTEAGVQFFRLISVATRNEVLVLLVDSLTDILRYVLERIGLFERPDQLAPIRRRILKHLRARDAVKAMHETNRYMRIVHQRITDPPSSAD